MTKIFLTEKLLWEKESMAVLAWLRRKHFTSPLTVEGSHHTEFDGHHTNGLQSALQMKMMMVPIYLVLRICNITYFGTTFKILYLSCRPAEYCVYAKLWTDFFALFCSVYCFKTFYWNAERTFSLSKSKYLYRNTLIFLCYFRNFETSKY